MSRTQHEQDRQFLQGTPGEVWWDGEHLYYFAWLWQDGPGVPNTMMRMYRISNMPSTPRDVKKGSIHVSSGWRFVCTYLNENFMWTQGRGLNGGRTEKFWQEAFVNGIKRPRGVDSLGRPYNVYDYRGLPLSYNGETQIKYPTNVYGNLAHHNNGYQGFNARQGRLYGYRLQTKFSHNTSGSQYDTVCVGQLWRRTSHKYQSTPQQLQLQSPGPIIAVKYSRDARTDKRAYEYFTVDAHITGNNNPGKEIMIIDIQGTGVDNQDTLIFYQTTGRPAIQPWGNEPDVRHGPSLFNGKRVYQSSVRDLWQYFTHRTRPHGQMTLEGILRVVGGSSRINQLAQRFFPPLTNDEPENNNTGSSSSNKGPTQEEIAKRIQSDTWKKEWGYGADFIKWREKEREQNVDLTDGSGSGSSSTGGSNPKHPHQRAKRKATSDPDFERRFTALHRTGRGQTPRQSRPRQEYYAYMWTLVEIPHELRMVWTIEHLRPTEADGRRIPIRVGDSVVRQYDGQWDRRTRPGGNELERINYEDGLNTYKVFGYPELYNRFTLAVVDENADEDKMHRWGRVRKKLDIDMNYEMFKAKLKF